MAKIPVFLFLALLVLTEYLDAQNAIVPVGTDVESQAGKISYTVGQIAYHQFTSQAGSVNEGVQQVFKDSIVNVFEVEPSASHSFTIYPNPFDGLLTICKSSAPTMLYTYMLYSPEMKLVSTGNLVDEHTCLTTERILPGVYYLVILKEDMICTRAKIVKIR